MPGETRDVNPVPGDIQLECGRRRPVAQNRKAFRNVVIRFSWEREVRSANSGNGSVRGLLAGDFGIMVGWASQAPANGMTCMAANNRMVPCKPAPMSAAPVRSPTSQQVLSDQARCIVEKLLLFMLTDIGLAPLPDETAGNGYMSASLHPRSVGMIRSQWPMVQVTPMVQVPHQRAVTRNAECAENIGANSNASATWFNGACGLSWPT